MENMRLKATVMVGGTFPENEQLKAHFEQCAKGYDCEIIAICGTLAVTNRLGLSFYIENIRKKN